MSCVKTLFHSASRSLRIDSHSPGERALDEVEGAPQLEEEREIARRPRPRRSRCAPARRSRRRAKRHGERRAALLRLALDQRVDLRHVAVIADVEQRRLEQPPRPRRSDAFLPSHGASRGPTRRASASRSCVRSPSVAPGASRTISSARAGLKGLPNTTSARALKNSRSDAQGWARHTRNVCRYTHQMPFADVTDCGPWRIEIC